MQPIAYDVQNMHIFWQDTAPRPNSKKGYADKRFQKSETTYRVYLRPTADSMSKDASGQIPDVRYRGVINQRVPLSLGDRLGTDKPEFEVVSLLTLSYPIQHQMELKKI